MAAPKYLGDFAVLTPDKPAVINGTTGASLSYRELEERSNRFAQYLYALGLRRRERVAVLLENHLRRFAGGWGWGGGGGLGWCWRLICAASRGRGRHSFRACCCGRSTAPGPPTRRPT